MIASLIGTASERPNRQSPVHRLAAYKISTTWATQCFNKAIAMRDGIFVPVIEASDNKNVYWICSRRLGSPHCHRPHVEMHFSVLRKLESWNPCRRHVLLTECSRRRLNLFGSVRRSGNNQRVNVWKYFGGVCVSVVFEPCAYRYATLACPWIALEGFEDFKRTIEDHVWSMRTMEFVAGTPIRKVDCGNRDDDRCDCRASDYLVRIQDFVPKALWPICGATGLIVSALLLSAVLLRFAAHEVTVLSPLRILPLPYRIGDITVVNECCS
jgi:hypothetical protein